MYRARSSLMTPSLFVCRVVCNLFAFVCRLTPRLSPSMLTTARPAGGLMGCLIGCLMGCLIYRRPYLYSFALYAIADPCPRSVYSLHIPLKKQSQLRKQLQAVRGVTFVKQGENFLFSPCNPLCINARNFQSMEISINPDHFAAIYCHKLRLFQTVRWHFVLP